MSPTRSDSGVAMTWSRIVGVHDFPGQRIEGVDGQENPGDDLVTAAHTNRFRRGLVPSVRHDLMRRDMIEDLEQNGRSAGAEAPEIDIPIVIIGAGFAGTGMAIQLLKAGIDSFMMFERAGEIGGIWRDNTYPGAACDVPSHARSLSFEPNPNWSRKFSPSEEIQGYLLHLVEKWRLRDHLRLDTSIAEAHFDESTGTWTLRTGVGATLSARVVISAVGGLVDPACPTSPVSSPSRARSSTRRVGTTTTIGRERRSR